jgi:hypothetical protein
LKSAERSSLHALHPLERLFQKGKKCWWHSILVCGMNPLGSKTPNNKLPKKPPATEG